MTNVQQATTQLTINSVLVAAFTEADVYNPTQSTGLLVPAGSSGISETTYLDTIQSQVLNLQLPTAGTTANQGLMNVTTSAVQIPLGSVKVPGYYHLVNGSGLFTINIQDSSGNEVATLPAGTQGLIPANSALYAVAPSFSLTPYSIESASGFCIPLQFLVTEYLGQLSIPSGDTAF